MKICTIRGCSGKHRAKGYCETHYRRAVRTGSTSSNRPIVIRTGITKHSLYKAWLGMRNRCNNPNASDYKYYGGRGITVCDRWTNFANFLADMGERPEGMTLDRIDGNKGYYKQNCRWATKQEQIDNRHIRSKEILLL